MKDWDWELNQEISLRLGIQGIESEMKSWFCSGSDSVASIKPIQPLPMFGRSTGHFDFQFLDYGQMTS